ncbi:MAG TPA: cobalt-precorrin-6A reductase [Epulopiscium sp.]|nr:cobalt-precorrin-6A reductase [Candidatus Epulonipiscium sp.]
MIGLFLGTSEGREILRNLNEFTDNIYVSTATEYGASILGEYRYKHLNTAPLAEKDMIRVVEKYGISMIIDASHPYATEVTDNIMATCEQKDLAYLRYERASVVDAYIPHPDIIILDDYKDLKENLKDIPGVIINTTGSNNVEKLEIMKLSNRIIHKVLPIKEVLTKLYYLKVPIKNIIAIYGGGSKELNQALFEEYNAKAVIMKDSGKQGKTKEKIEAALEMGIKVFIIGRKKKQYENVFESEKEIVDFARKLQENNKRKEENKNEE